MEQQPFQSAEKILSQWYPDGVEKWIGETCFTFNKYKVLKAMEEYASQFNKAKWTDEDIKSAFEEGHKKGWLRGVDGLSGWQKKDTAEYLQSLKINN